jgi:hypothetical protein
LGFIANIAILLTHTNHDTLVLGTTNDGWEDGSWSIITSETGFAHTGTVVAYERCYFFFVAHFRFVD